MKRYIALFVLAALVLAAPAIAEEHTAQAQTAIQAEAGVTPDSALYGLATAWERTRSALTFGAAAKADLNLEYANKRLAEVEAMLEANNTQAAQKAAQRYEANVNTAAQATARIRNDGNEARAVNGLEQSTKARAQLQANLAHAAQVHASILERQEARMDAEQYARIESVFGNISQAGLQADMRIEETRAQSQKRYQAAASVNEEQARARAANISAQQGLNVQLEAHQNALEGLRTALQASAQANEQAQTAIQARIETTTQAREGIGARVAGIDVRAGTQAQQERASEREEREEDERKETSARAEANTTVGINGQNTSAGVQGRVQIR